MFRRHRWTLLAALAILVASVLLLRETTFRSPIREGREFTQRIDLRHPAEAPTVFESPRSDPAPAAERAEVSPRIVCFSLAPSSQDLEQLKALGVELLQGMGGNRALYHVPPSAEEAIRRLPFIDTVASVRSMEKLAEPVRQVWDADPFARPVLAVLFHRPVARSSAREALAQAGMEFVGDEDYEGDSTLLARGGKVEVNRLAGDDHVYQIWPPSTPPTPSNWNAAQMSRVNEIQPGGMSLYGLTGSGVTLAMWDMGGVRPTHVEFGSRVINKDSAPISEHATAVAGTIIASGVWQVARGMSPGARLWAFDWRNMVSEWNQYRGSFATGNLSIGFATGWEYDYQTGWWTWYGPSGSEVDPRFGKYTNWCRNVDASTSYLNILLVGAAGNDREHVGTTGPHLHYGSNDTHNDKHNADNYADGYDTLFEFSSAKNLLVVGAVDANYQSAPFSSWGPTDDNRIKPDLVAGGMWMDTTGSATDRAYLLLHGTSFSTAVVTGICGLLTQKLHLHGLQPGTAPPGILLKALLIHTAQDLGRPGPDPQFGWGLADARAAADVIQKDVGDGPWTNVVNSVLRPLQRLTYTVEHPGDHPFRATLVWADPPGNANTGGDDDMTPALVHDLDLRVIDPRGGVYAPWRFPFDWHHPAEQEDNDVDTVERVDIPAEDTVRGTYRIEISHKGTLTRDQIFTLIAEGLVAGGPEPLIPPSTPQKLSPTGIVLSNKLRSVTLRWDAAEHAQEYQVILQDGERTWRYITSQTSYSVLLPHLGEYRWAVRTLNAAGASDWAQTSFTLTTLQFP